MFDQILETAIDSTVPSGISHIGFVAHDVYGRYLISAPHGAPDGVTATFAKVRVDPDESPAQNLHRCIEEQIGRPVNSVYPIRNVLVNPNNTGFYFTGWIHSSFDDVASSKAALQWCEPDQARGLLERSSNPTTRRRDLGLMAAAEQICPSPYRNVLLMVRELHRMGFERLRAFCYVAAVGAWRCQIIPAAWSLNDRVGRPIPDIHSDPFDKYRTSWRWYSAASEQQVFRHESDVFLTPKELAERFVHQNPVVAMAGYGPDELYVDWFEQALAELAPHGIYYAFAEYQSERPLLYTHFARTSPDIPQPPTGHADAAEWERFRDRSRK